MKKTYTRCRVGLFLGLLGFSTLASCANRGKELGVRDLLELEERKKLEAFYEPLEYDKDPLGGQKEKGRKRSPLWYQSKKRFLCGAGTAGVVTLVGVGVAVYLYLNSYSEPSESMMEGTTANTMLALIGNGTRELVDMGNTTLAFIGNGTRELVDMGNTTLAPIGNGTRDLVDMGNTTLAPIGNGTRDLVDIGNTTLAPIGTAVTTAVTTLLSTAGLIAAKLRPHRLNVDHNSSVATTTPFMPTYRDRKITRAPIILHQKIINEILAPGFSETSAQYWFDKGLPIDERDVDGHTLLMRVAQLNDLKAIRWLVSKGANQNLKNNDGNTAIVYPNFFDSNGREIANYFGSMNNTDLCAKNKKGESIKNKKGIEFLRKDIQEKVKKCP